MKFCGIDLHSNNSVVVVSDADDRIVLQRRLPNSLGAILAALAPHRDELAGMVVESTYNWYWLVDGLLDAGYRLHLAHVAAIKRFKGLKHGGDAADAAYLAQLLRLGLLPEGYIYPAEQRRARDLARKRIQLVRWCAAQVLSVENLVVRHTGARPGRAQVKRMTADQVNALGLPPHVALALKANLAICEILQQIAIILQQMSRVSTPKTSDDLKARVPSSVTG